MKNYIDDILENLKLEDTNLAEAHAFKNNYKQQVRKRFERLFENNINPETYPEIFEDNARLILKKYTNKVKLDKLISTINIYRKFNFKFNIDVLDLVSIYTISRRKYTETFNKKVFDIIDIRFSICNIKGIEKTEAFIKERKKDIVQYLIVELYRSEYNLRRYINFLKLTDYKFTKQVTKDGLGYFDGFVILQFKELNKKEDNHE